MQDKMFQRFKRFHKNNPHVWATFCEYSKYAISRWPMFSAGMVLELMRLNITLHTVDTITPGTNKKFTISNNYKPYYARLFNVLYMVDFYEIRKNGNPEPLEDDQQLTVSQREWMLDQVKVVDIT